MIDLTRRTRLATRDPRVDRTLARLPRALVFTVVGVLIALGVRSLLLGPPPAPAAAQRNPLTQPDLAAEGFAAEFASRYLAFDPRHPDERLAALHALVGEGLGADLGSDPPVRLAQRVRSVRVVADELARDATRMITVAVDTDRHGLLHLAVPVGHDAAGRLRLTGYPALVGAPETAAARPPALRAVRDPALERVARRAIANYLARDGEDLQADLASEARVALPALALSVEGAADVEQAGRDRVRVTVRARDGDGGRYTLAYELGVAIADRWSITAVHTLPTHP